MAVSNHYGTLPLCLPPAKGSLIETYRPLVRVARHPRDLLSCQLYPLSSLHSALEIISRA
jgi:hypothetical protein